MEKQYQPEKYEQEIYQLWEKSGFFNPDNLPGGRKDNYSIVIPPPNITGSLHIGHALNNTIQDILIRFYRMKGKKTLWLPGIDHAGIAAQNVVEKNLAKKNITRHQLGREEFIKRVKAGEDAEKVLDDLGVERYCCRRMIFSHVDVVKEIAKYNA